MVVLELWHRNDYNNLMRTMALEEQELEQELFRKLLKKRTDDIFRVLRGSYGTKTRTGKPGPSVGQCSQDFPFVSVLFLDSP